MIAGVDIDKCYNVAVKLASEAGEVIQFFILKKIKMKQYYWFRLSYFIDQYIFRFCGSTV